MPNSMPNLYAFPSGDAIAPALRSYVIQAQNDAIERHGRFRVAVSGGSLPKILAAALLPAGSGPKDAVDFSKWDIFFADERAVPLDHADSNYALLKTELLDKIPGVEDLMGEDLSEPEDEDEEEPKTEPPTEHKLRVRKLKALKNEDLGKNDKGESVYKGDTQDLADRYNWKIVKTFAVGDAVKVPTFNLLLLGCGPDGHTCSLFPGHELLEETVAWVAPIDDSPKPPLNRITLTLPVVRSAERVAFVATGAGKVDAMKKIFESTEKEKLPCALVNDEAGGKVSWFVDEPAVEGVSFPRRAFL